MNETHTEIDTEIDTEIGTDTDTATATGTATGTTTQDDTEAHLTEVWLELLDIDSVEPGNRLLELGGNSLIATMMANRIELTWGFRPSMETLLTATFHELATVCARLRDE